MSWSSFIMYSNLEWLNIWANIGVAMGGTLPHSGWDQSWFAQDGLEIYLAGGGLLGRMIGKKSTFVNVQTTWRPFLAYLIFYSKMSVFPLILEH